MQLTTNVSFLVIIFWPSIFFHLINLDFIPCELILSNIYCFKIWNFYIYRYRTKEKIENNKSFFEEMFFHDEINYSCKLIQRNEERKLSIYLFLHFNHLHIIIHLHTN